MTERAPDCPQAPLDAALEAYPDPVRLIGAEGRVLYRNRAARESLPEGLGHRCGGDPGAGSSDCPACGVWRTAEDGQLRRWHVVVDPPPSSEGERSDARRYYEVTLTRVPLEGGRWGVVEFVRDVTITFGLEHTLAAEADRLEHEITRRAAEIEQLEKRTDEMRTLLARLRQSQMEAMARDRTMVLGQMAAALAHEIHTPLGALIASVEVLEHGLSKLRQAAAESDDAHTSRTVGARLESLDNAVGIVCEASRRIEQLVRSMRLFTRVDEGARKRVDLHAGIESSMTLLGHQTRDRIRFVRSFGELPEVVCRPSAINQVFLNLLLNAVQAIEGRGQIEIRTR
ncbi:MAG: PAS domain-containing protein, partial [Acidobacteriota bacterium]